MDTASHLLFGATLAGLAHLDPAVAQNAALAQAMLAGTMIGSHAPDFDTFVRLKGYSAYIRYHRGITHSIPALFIWPAVIALPLANGFQVTEYTGLLYVWIWIAVWFHVFLDMLNTYGVQSLRPLTRKWVHLDVLAIFEPFLFVIHTAGLGMWLLSDMQPGPIFQWIYGITLGYIAVRFFYHGVLVRRVRQRIGLQPGEGTCHVLPTFHWFQWRFVLETGDRFSTGKVEGRRVVVDDTYLKEESNHVIQATLETDGVRAFLGFAQRIHVTCRELADGYEVSWSDVRFWYDRKLPFGVDVLLDKNLNVVSHSLGWRKKMWDPPFV